jgi:Protein of unknown function (DUF2892)
VVVLTALKELKMELFPKNVGTADSVVRVVAGALMAVFGWYFGLSQAWVIGLSAMGVMTAMSGLLCSCTIYRILGISTRRKV